MHNVLWPSAAVVILLAEPVIKGAEGFAARPYLCPAGVPTIGWGTTRYADGHAVQLTDPPLSQSEAGMLLQVTMRRVLTDLQVPGLITRAPSAHQAAALLSLAYNIGIGAHDGVKGDFADSTLLSRFNAGDIFAAAAQFAVWNKTRVRGVPTVLPGLTARRAVEARLFLTPDTAGV